MTPLCLVVHAKSSYACSLFFLATRYTCIYTNRYNFQRLVELECVMKEPLNPRPYTFYTASAPPNSSRKRVSRGSSGGSSNNISIAKEALRVILLHIGSRRRRRRRRHDPRLVCVGSIDSGRTH